MHSFDALCGYLFELRARGHPKKGFILIRALLKKLKNPEKAYKTIHVTGSNGKGSVSLKLAQTLQLSGYKVGLYTSPHLISVQERIRVQGEPISQERFCSLCEKILSLANNEIEKISFFEILTIIAFEYFQEQKVDVAVIEAGIGGTLDTTNVIMPCLSVITSISKEHADTLGNTLEQIAGHKAGIIKRNVPVVIGPRAGLQPIYDRAKHMQAPLFSVKECSMFYDIENKELARLGLAQLGSHFQLSPEAIEEGIQIRPPCRFEQIGEVIFDVAHNPDGIRKLLDAVNMHFSGRDFQVLIGMSSDKDLEACLSQLTMCAKRIHLVPINSYKSADLNVLEHLLTKLSYHNFSSYPSISQGMEKALSYPELLIVCGSFYIMQEAKSMYSSQQFPLEKFRIDR